MPPYPQPWMQSSVARRNCRRVSRTSRHARGVRRQCSAGQWRPHPRQPAVELSRDLAVQHLDALARATGVTTADALLLAEKYPRARGLPRARLALALMDAGAQSPKETWLRLVLIDGGLPAPRTQIRVTDGVSEAFIDMGYDEPMVGLDYEGTHHSENRGQYVYDIGRAELIDRRGWIDIRVVAEHSRRFILHRVDEAFTRRGYTPKLL
jgi:hypothetical protein